MATKTPLIKVSDLSYAYFAPDSGKHYPVIKEVSFEILPGEFTCLVGPSGCGKSTLLKIIAKLLKTNKAENINNEAKKMAMVFQNFALFPWLKVLDNVAYGLKMEGIPLKKRRVLALEKIKEVGLDGFEHHYPHELSGGMKQRVGLARALAVSPDLLLMDEPFSSLDVLTAEKLRQLLLELWSKYQMTIVMVTHLVEEAVEVSDKIIIFGPRPTTIIKEMEVKLLRPRDKRSGEYYDLVDKIGAMIK